MFDTEQSDTRTYRFKKPGNPEETLSAIHEELSLTPQNRHDKRPEQTIKGYLHDIREQMRKDSRGQQQASEDRERSGATSLGACGLLGLVLVIASTNLSGEWQWWRQNSYFFFVFGMIVTVMFVAASMERTSVITQMLKFNSVKILLAFVFSSALIYASAQASSQLNAIFGIDAANLPYTRAILSAAYFLKMCQPFVLVLAVFVLVHIVTVWGAAQVTKDVMLLPWNSLLFIIGSFFVVITFWWIADGAFGKGQIEQKAYKLAHYLDFSSKAYCVESTEEQRYLFFGQDQNKVLIDKKLKVEESFEEFLKGKTDVALPSAFKTQPCLPRPPAEAAPAPAVQ